jgi:hypothetical protein
MPNKQQAGAKLLVRCTALAGGLAALFGMAATVLGALDVIRVEWDRKWLICTIAAILCCGFVVVCGLAWRLHRGAIVALCSGYLLVGFMLGLQSALLMATGFAPVGHERQIAATAVIALVLIVAGIAIHRQIAILNDAS